MRVEHVHLRYDPLVLLQLRHAYMIQVEKQVEEKL